MLVTAVGTVWQCQENPNYEEDDSAQYTAELVVYLPGRAGKDGPEGQAIKFSLDSEEPLQENMPYRVTARVSYIWPTQEGDDMHVAGVVVEAKLIE